MSAVQLLEADRGGQTGGAATDDDDVVLHRFARAVLGKDLFVRHGSFAWGGSLGWARILGMPANKTNDRAFL